VAVDINEDKICNQQWQTVSHVMLNMMLVPRFSIIPVKEILRQRQLYMSNILELAISSKSHQYGCNDQNTIFSGSKTS
jgi:hypothetical protein